MTLTVAKVAERAGINPDTVRYYERIGLLPTHCGCSDPVATKGNEPERVVLGHRSLALAGPSRKLTEPVCGCGCACGCPCCG